MAFCSYHSGRSSLVVKTKDSWLACHDFECSIAENPLCRGIRCELNVSKLKRHPVGVVWKLGERGAAQVSSSTFGYGSKLRGPSPKALA
ncbi:hypothetical protein TNCV_1240701 [Trichonephila clavipes]|uniref:Uncharacterized protein n=1 Tax=Trichonephila clavipes TaxID=2585209 RepID=A0A8X6WE78_TRICX|nr:hypothetical protein TNCV_1240701 [Trichonephila clavipes]